MVMLYMFLYHGSKTDHVIKIDCFEATLVYALEHA